MPLLNPNAILPYQQANTPLHLTDHVQSASNTPNPNSNPTRKSQNETFLTLLQIPNSMLKHYPSITNQMTSSTPGAKQTRQTVHLKSPGKKAEKIMSDDRKSQTMRRLECSPMSESLTLGLPLHSASALYLDLHSKTFENLLILVPPITSLIVNSRSPILSSSKTSKPHCICHVPNCRSESSACRHPLPGNLIRYSQAE